MACADCRAVFGALETLEDSKLRAARLDELCPGCKCEPVSVSQYSSGPVVNSESLVRLLIAPQHRNRRNGSLRASSLTDAETHGLSLFREDQATDREIVAQAERLIERARRSNPGAGVFGLLRLNGGHVRSFRHVHDVGTSYCIYNTASSQSPSHAEAFQRVAGVDVALREARRIELFGLVHTGFVPVSEFRNGLLAHLSPPA